MTKGGVWGKDQIRTPGDGRFQARAIRGAAKGNAGRRGRNLFFRRPKGGWTRGDDPPKTRGGQVGRWGDSGRPRAFRLMGRGVAGRDGGAF